MANLLSMIAQGFGPPGLSGLVDDYQKAKQNKESINQNRLMSILNEEKISQIPQEREQESTLNDLILRKRRADLVGQQSQNLAATEGRAEKLARQPYVDATEQLKLQALQQKVGQGKQSKYGKPFAVLDQRTGERRFAVSDQFGQTKFLDDLQPERRRGITVTTDPSGATTTTIGGSGPVTKSIRSKVQKKILDTGDTMANITAIKARYRPEFQRLGTKWDALVLSVKDKLNIKLDAKEGQLLDDFSQHKAGALQNFSLVLKDLSGVAVNPTEFKRAEGWLPNPGTGLFDGDSPRQFEAKVKRFEDFAKRSLMKYAYINRYGLSVDDVDVNQMPGLMNKRGKELEAEFKRQGMKGADVTNAVKQQLADEFGLIR